MLQGKTVLLGVTGSIAAYKQEAYAKFGAENFGDASRAAVEDMIADISGALESAK